MTYVFAIVIAAFALISLAYIYVNSFSPDITPILYPAVGAILVSLFLMYKSVIIDAPSDQTSKTPVVIFDYPKSGQILTMTPSRIDDPVELGLGFRGIEAINWYQARTKFKGLKVWNFFHPGMGQSSDEERDNKFRALTNILEYSILDWLSRAPEANFNFIDSSQIVFAGGSSGASSFTNEGVPVSPMRHSDEHNPFLKADEVKIDLPKGSNIQRPSGTGWGFEIQIRTPHSKADFSVRTSGQSGFGAGEDQVTRSLVQRFSNLPVMHGFIVEVKTSQNPFVRFSDRAKKEAKWLERLHRRFEKDFSWELLKAVYVRAATN